MVRCSPRTGRGLARCQRSRETFVLMELPAILEALLFSSQRPLSPRELKEILARAADESSDAAVPARQAAREKEIQAALEQLAADYQAAARSYQLSCVAGSWQFVSRPEYAPWLKAF